MNAASVQSAIVAVIALLALLVLCGDGPAMGAVAGVSLGWVIMRGFRGPR